MQYYGNENDYTNLLTPDEVNTYAGYAGGNTTDFELRDMEVEVEVGEGEDLTIGIKTGNQRNNGVRSTSDNAGWFKVDFFRIHRIGGEPDAIKAQHMGKGHVGLNKGVIYNTAGLSLTNPHHGLYIVNGRKVALR